jgi:hypothetical protein
LFDDNARPEIMVLLCEYTRWMCLEGEMVKDDQDTFAERLQASVVKYLYDTDEYDAASAVLSCEIEFFSYYSDTGEEEWVITLRAPAAVHKQYVDGMAYDSKNRSQPIEGTLPEKIEKAFGYFNSSYLYSNRESVTIFCLPKLLDINDADWKTALQRLLTGDNKLNQGLSTEKSPYHQYWQGMHFGSASELEIAKALDRKGIMYFPACLARVGDPDYRSNKEPDFLVCHNGKWGIIEVDGKPFHPPERTAKEHERGRQFKHHGLKVVEHFDAEFCRDHADEVVSDFLKILEQS